MSASAAHRVAVVGGGVSGGVCATLLRRQGLNVTLFERSKRLGGRASARKVRPRELETAKGASSASHVHFDQGAQFFTVTDPRFKMLVESPLVSGHIEEWQGRFGVLGSRGGEVLPRENVLTSGMFRTPTSRADEDEAVAAAAAARTKEMLRAPINYCGFLEGSTSTKLYTGVGGMGALIPAMLREAQVNVQKGTRIADLTFTECDGSHRRKWLLTSDEDVQHEPFDSVVLANHDPAFAADVIERLQAGAPDPELSQDAVASVIGQFANRLRGLRSTQQSRYSLLLAFPRALSELPFDAASVHGSELQFLSRESSKPGRGGGEGDGVECWVAQSSADFAATLDSRLSPSSSSDAAAPMLEAVERLLGRFFEGGSMPAPLHSQSRRWHAAFFPETLELNAAGETHNDAVTFGPWSIALCGDYFGARQGVEEAALSGMMAANRVAQWASERR